MKAKKCHAFFVHITRSTLGTSNINVTKNVLRKCFMKHRLLLTFIGVAISIGVMAQSNRTNPDVAKYYIKGNLSIEKGADGKTVYKLSQIDNSGIYFEDLHATRIGEETSLEDVLFQFSRASTDYSGGINTPLDFWRYDNAINEWQPDVETRQGTAGVETKKSMVVMLVLDCSASLGTDFNLVQGAANSFIRSLYESSKGSGNIKLGVVGFSKINETRVFNIRSLTSDSYYEMTSFINRLSTQNGTALYCAMDKSISELMEEYCRNSIPSSEPLSAAIMVTFTDGLDQTSRISSLPTTIMTRYLPNMAPRCRIRALMVFGCSMRHAGLKATTSFRKPN